MGFFPRNLSGMSEQESEIATGLIQSWIWDGLEKRGLPYHGLVIEVRIEEEAFRIVAIWGAEVNPTLSRDIEGNVLVSYTDYTTSRYAGDLFAQVGFELGAKIDNSLDEYFETKPGEFRNHLKSFRDSACSGAGNSGIEVEAFDLTGMSEGKKFRAVLKLVFAWPKESNGFADLATIRYITRSQMIQAENISAMLAAAGTNAWRQLSEGVQHIQGELE